MVTFTAWDQYREAKKLFVDVRNDLGQDVIPSGFYMALNKILSKLNIRKSSTVSDEEGLSIRNCWYLCLYSV